MASEQYVDAKSFRAWHNLRVMKNTSPFEPQLAVSLRVMRILLTMLWLAIAPEVSAWLAPVSMPARQSRVGGQAVHREVPQTLTGSLGDRIDDALANGDVNATRQLLPKFLAEAGLAADALLQAGVNLARHDLYTEAEQVFGRCVKDYPNMFEGYYNLALAELALREYSEALATVKKAPRGSPSDELARTYMRGKIEMALGQDAQAERDLSAAFAAAPEEENFALDLGLLYIREWKYQQAVEFFRKASGFRKNAPYLQLGLALAQYLGGQSLESVETCRALLAVQPDLSPARVMMAFGLYMGGKIGEAEKIAAQGLHDPNPFPYLYYLHAVALLKLQSKDYGGILNDLRLAVREIPRCSLCYLAFSKVHQRMGDQETALADLEKAVNLDPSFAEAWYRLVPLYDQAGRHAEAQQAQRRFEGFKEDKANRETEILRNVFLKVLGGEGSPEDNR